MSSSGSHGKDFVDASLLELQYTGRDQDNNSVETDVGIKGNNEIVEMSLDDFIILPGDSLEITLNFSSPDTGLFTTNLFVSSDDPIGNDLLSIGLDAHSVAPEITLTKTMSVVTYVNNDIPFNIAVNNPGGWPLDYTVEVDADWVGFQWLEVNQLAGQVPGFTTADLEVQGFRLGTLNMAANNRVWIARRVRSQHWRTCWTGPGYLRAPGSWMWPAAPVSTARRSRVRDMSRWASTSPPTNCDSHGGGCLPCAVTPRTSRCLTAPST